MVNENNNCLNLAVVIFRYLYFLIATPLIFLAADQAPEYRKTILQAVSAVELIVVGNNLRLGLHF
jgi:hypothetical protein